LKYGTEAVHFTSHVFIIFLVVFFALYWCARTARWQNAILVVASYLFYGWWDYRFCALILFSSLVDFVIGSKLFATEVKRKRIGWLVLSLVSNLGLLALFKYFGFFADNLNLLAQSLGWSLHPITLNIILPVGISFYTFQTLSYTIDIYRKHLEPADSLVDYLAFVSFFPQLVAGPIERGKNLLPQFQALRKFDRGLAEDGCRWILWGFFKKLAIADPLAVAVDQSFGDWGSASGGELTLATIFFAFQIYCDFSAYSDIAIGTAKLFSVNLMRNFAYPYFSQSIGEFWRRWHISLSTWFRDYIYFPLGGSRMGKARTGVNLMVTFLLSGLWHGAAWTFVAWGGLHGAFPHPVVTLKILTTFAIVCCGWVFFRANSIQDAVGILHRMFTNTFSSTSLAGINTFVKLHETTILILLLFIGVEWVRRRHECPLSSGRSIFAPVRWAVYSFLIWGSLYLIADIDEQPFVYFAF